MSPRRLACHPHDPLRPLLLLLAPFLLPLVLLSSAVVAAASEWSLTGREGVEQRVTSERLFGRGFPGFEAKCKCPRTSNVASVTGTATKEDPEEVADMRRDCLVVNTLEILDTLASLSSPELPSLPTHKSVQCSVSGGVCWSTSIDCRRLFRNHGANIGVGQSGSLPANGQGPCSRGLPASVSSAGRPTSDIHPARPGTRFTRTSRCTYSLRIVGGREILCSSSSSSSSSSCHVWQHNKPSLCHHPRSLSCPGSLS